MLDLIVRLVRLTDSHSPSSSLHLPDPLHGSLAFAKKDHELFFEQAFERGTWRKYLSRAGILRGLGEMGGKETEEAGKGHWGFRKDEAGPGSD